MATERPSAESLELARGICPFEANHRLERTGIPCPNCVAMALLLDRANRAAQLPAEQARDLAARDRALRQNIEALPTIKPLGYGKDFISLDAVLALLPKPAERKD
jgi:hypothetical protein